MTMKRASVKGFWKLPGDLNGTTHAEYALILAIIGTAIVFCSLWLGGVINPTVNNAATCISTSGTDCTGKRLRGDLPDPNRPVR